VYKTSNLPNKMFAVFIDAYHAKMRDDKMKDIHIITALGIDLEGNKSILGFWVNDGSESKGIWSDIFQDLINGGLKEVVLFVTDDFPGVKEIISKLYPLADHQLCWVHFTRNLRRHLSKAEYAEIKEDLYMAKNSKNEKDGEKHIEDLCNKIKVKHKDLAERIEERKDNYLAFLKYPEGVRKHIYTTNAIESINAGLEYIRHELGGYFPSRNALETNYFIQIENLNDGWQRRPVPALKASTYELRQIYTMKYELEEWEND
ncbi:MAG: IS256 family transposase, partial [Caldisericum sp.]|uniref:IS256 family transposase n=1 Tax=Caldisericum sp. TaxID=2499687 RepID=UPI003D103447